MWNPIKTSDTECAPWEFRICRRLIWVLKRTNVNIIKCEKNCLIYSIREAFSDEKSYMLILRIISYMNNFFNDAF